MATSIIQRHCKTCQQKRPFERPCLSHLLHLILTLMTGGAWLIIWIFLGIGQIFTAYRCRFCGGTKY